MSFILTLFSFRELTSRSMRLYPFLQNTGGFFVAVLEKVGIYGALDRYGSNHSDVPGCDIDEERQDTQTEEDVRPIHEIVTNGHAAEKIDETVTDGDAAENIDKIVANGDAADDRYGRRSLINPVGRKAEQIASRCRFLVAVPRMDASVQRMTERGAVCDVFRIITTLISNLPSLQRRQGKQAFTK